MFTKVRILLHFLQTYLYLLHNLKEFIVKNSFLLRTLSVMLLFSVANTFTMEDDKNQGALTTKDEYDTQKMLLMFGGSAVALAGTHFLADRFNFPDVGDFFNLSRGEFTAACGLSSLLSGIGLIANEKWRPTLRSVAWRIPLMAIVGGVLNHPKFNKGLTYAPLGLGGWFRDNPPFGKPGIGAIYAIGSWYAAKPYLDNAENSVTTWWASKKGKRH